MFQSAYLYLILWNGFLLINKPKYINHLPITPSCWGVKCAVSMPSGIGRPVLARLPDAMEALPLVIIEPCLPYFSPYILLNAALRRPLLVVLPKSEIQMFSESTETNY